MSQMIFGPHGGHAGAGTRDFFSEVREWAKALGHIPGQKNLIFFSRGFGYRPNSPDAGPFELMAKQLASANAPVFSVNTATGVEAKVRAGVFPERSLEYLSKMTGGKYFYDVNYYSKNAEGIQTATSNYYVLGYSIASTWDGKFHDIRVEVKRPGYVVAAQRGYFNPRPFNTLSPMEKHLQLLDLTLGEKGYFEEHLNFPMAALHYSDNGEANTLLLAQVPVQRIRETVGNNTELISLVFDENRTIADSKRVEMDWAKVKGEEIFQYSVAALAPGRYDCRVVIRNMDNGKAAVGACALEIPLAPVASPAAPPAAVAIVPGAAASEKAKLSVFPPLLLVSGRKAQYLNISGQDKVGAVKEVSLAEIFPFPAQEFAPLVGGLEQGVEAVCGAVRCAFAGTQAPELEFSAWLVPDGSNQKIDLTAEPLGEASQAGAKVYLLNFELPELQPGRYTLHLLAKDPSTKVASETSSAFSIGALPGGEKK
jgi:hypothetical protein